MLSIRFDTDHEWWISSQVFERLFVSALDHDQLSRELEEWRHVADANGGSPWLTSSRRLPAISRLVYVRRQGRSSLGLDMLEYLPMSLPTREELLRDFPPVDDPEIMARRRHSLRVLLDMDPQLQQQLRLESRLEGRLEGRLSEARAALRRVLARRQLTPSKTRIHGSKRAPTSRPWSAGTTRPSPPSAFRTRWRSRAGVLAGSLLHARSSPPAASASAGAKRTRVVVGEARQLTALDASSRRLEPVHVIAHRAMGNASSSRERI